MQLKMDYVDQVYEFPGLWDVPSVCGLKITKKPNAHVVVATELWDQNPGTSITNFCIQLATRLCGEFQLDPTKLVFIEHCPESGSHLEIYEQTIDRVELHWDGEKFADPAWTRLTLKELDALLS
jgi:hypothetical protein